MHFQTKILCTLYLQMLGNPVIILGKAASNQYTVFIADSAGKEDANVLLTMWVRVKFCEHDTSQNHL